MRTRRSRRLLAATAVVPVIALAGACEFRGPNSPTDPYVRSTVEGVEITSLLTVGDGGSADNGYEMVGIPDGLGARLDANSKAVVTMNHELKATEGITRLHGSRGAFVSRYEIDPTSKRVTKGEDLIQPGVLYYNYLTNAYNDTAVGGGTRSDGKLFPAYTNEFSRFCSASLTKPGQLFNGKTGKGYLGQIQFANEESNDEGRVFGVTEDGTNTKQLPRLGLGSWENRLVAATTNDTTLVQGNEDGGLTSQLWAYVGSKIAAGSATTRAGLNNGRSNVVKLADGNPTTNTDAGFRATYAKGTPVPFSLSDVEWNQSGADQNAQAAAQGLNLNRIEDGAFDPNSPNDYYFVTTDGGAGVGNDGGGGGLWKLSYTDINQPNLGGILTLLLDGSESVHLNKPDNIDIDTAGNLLIQEDPGDSAAVSRIVAYRISDGATGDVAQFDQNLFNPASPNLITQDEESSGIIDASDTFGQGAFLFDAQVHTAAGLPPGNGQNTVEEYVQKGQLLLMVVRDWSKVYGTPAA